MAHIQLKNITKKFGNHTALSDLDLDIADGEFFVLLGETGAGKTTTLRLIAGLEKPTAGQIFIDGADVADWGAAERDVALVLQQYSLYPRYTVRENLEFPLKSKIRRVRRRRDRGARRARRQDAAHRASARPQDRPAVGRRDAARLDRPRHRAQAARLPDGRAAVGARRQAARGAAHRAQEPADESRRRPSCSSPTTRSRRCRWATRSACSTTAAWCRPARRNEIYNNPREHLRRALRRLAADEPARRQAGRRAAP